MNASSLSLIFAGLSVGTAAVFHIIGLVNAEKARRLAIETRQAEFLNGVFERIVEPAYWNQFQEIIHEWKWDDYDDFMVKFGPAASREHWGRLWLTCGRWEHLGLLVRDGIVTPELVWHWVGAHPIALWNKLEPIIIEYRERVEAEPKGMVFEWFEDLVVVLRRERARDRQSFPARRLRRERQKAESAAVSS